MGVDYSLEIHGAKRYMCCAGCRAVAQAIVESGLGDYYRYRTEHALSPPESVPDFLRQTKAYDHPQVQRALVRHLEAEKCETSLIVEGITCAACAWLNERHLQSLPGVLEARVNLSTHRASVQWDSTQIHLSEILEAIGRIGYLAHPYDPALQEGLVERERRQHLQRIGVAGLAGMQVMMIAVALYAGSFQGMGTGERWFLQWVSLLLTVPIVVYSARPFFDGALRDLRRLQLGMDIPVSLAIGMAFAGSVWATVTSEGAIYFDSVAMFAFFLLLGRYGEFLARRRGAYALETLGRALPALATRLVTTEGKEHQEVVSTAELGRGDRVLIRPGERIPCDGHVLAGASSVDESLLTGESRPIRKQVGTHLVGGTINIENPLTMRVEEIGTGTVVSRIIELVERAQTERPRIAQLADRVAVVFVAGVLSLALGVALYWGWQAPDAWFPITLSVLVVTCPCALSLATPAAITAATSTLARLGLMTTQVNGLQALSRATHFVFDKTGTLTMGELRLVEMHPFSSVPEQECLRLAASLERYSQHPIARALVGALSRGEFLDVSEVRNTAGMGLAGKINGTTYWIGTPEFIAKHTGFRLDGDRLVGLQRQGQTTALLADTQAIRCAFCLADTIRPGTQSLIKSLLAQGKGVSLLSGDHQRAVSHVAQTAGIDHFAFALSPREKLDIVKKLQAQGQTVAVVGDGINDAPVLSQAHVSIAMAAGTEMARASADFVLLSHHLSHLQAAIDVAGRTQRIIRQNLTWAGGYNLVVIPAAACGYIAPWMAAIGMSMSSLVVVANALRLTQQSNPS